MSQKDDANLEDVLQHLRATKAKAEADARRKGLDAGRQWIMSKRADVPMLDRLKRFYRLVSAEETTFEAEVEKGKINIYDLYLEISGKEEFDPDEAEQFWLLASRARADHENPVFLIAFVDAALGLWDDLSEKL